jgi:phytoene dehydrogenase-like protein
MTDNSLVADVVSTDHAWTGMSLAENFQGLVGAIEGGSWVDGLLAGAAFGTEVVATAIDPFSALLANGLGWAMEYFDPLQHMLDQLAGMPDVVASHAATWDNMAAELNSMATDLGAHLNGDLPDWEGRAATAYTAMMGHNVSAIGGLSAVASAMAAATEAAGNLVRFTREIVRDLIADLVARVIVWAAEAIFVVTIPVIAAQITAAVVKWAGRILSYTTALVTSLTNLTRLVNG